jgi:predicted membrane-bound spermidine synthase
VSVFSNADLQGTTMLEAAVFLFAPPAVLLGMMAPFAVRLKLADARAGGRTAGNLYAVSTVGSIVGTFLAGFVLIAWLGSTNILLLMAAASCWLWRPCWRRAAAPASKRWHALCSSSCFWPPGAMMFN